jgi:hypothetical protein
VYVCTSDRNERVASFVLLPATSKSRPSVHPLLMIEMSRPKRYRTPWKSTTKPGLQYSKQVDFLQSQHQVGRHRKQETEGRSLRSRGPIDALLSWWPLFPKKEKVSCRPRFGIKNSRLTARPNSKPPGNVNGKIFKGNCYRLYHEEEELLLDCRKVWRV